MVYRFIKAQEANHSIRRMCRVLNVARSSYHQWRAGHTYGGSVESCRTLVHIKAIYREHKGRYGAPRITKELQDQGLLVNHKRVARLMREHELVGLPRRSFRKTTTDSNHDKPVAPNLLNRQFNVEGPNQAIVGDITYLRTRDGWSYLAVLIDLFSRKVVGWAIDETMETSLCLRALRRALATRGKMEGAIHHTDRGSQYASRAYRSAVEEAGLKMSMSRKGNCWDNSVAESFFGTLKQELPMNKPWRNLAEARRAISTYIHRYYNSKRRHSTLGYVSPVEFEQNNQATMRDAA